MGAQLKEGLSQVQVAMAAGLFEGLREVTADLKRINQLVKQKFRRRMKRELQQQQTLEEQANMMKLHSADAQPNDLIIPKSPSSRNLLLVPRRMFNNADSDAAAAVFRATHTDGDDSTTVCANNNDNDIVDSSHLHSRRKRRSSSFPVIECPYREHQNHRRRRSCVECVEVKRRRKLIERSSPPDNQLSLSASATTGFHRDSTADETPETFIYPSDAPQQQQQRQNSKLLPARRLSSRKTIMTCYGGERGAAGESFSSSMSRMSRRNGLRKSRSRAHNRDKHNNGYRERHDHRRHHRLSVDDEDAVGAYVAQEDQYGDRLFELARLMPVKADVWEIDSPPDYAINSVRAGGGGSGWCSRATAHSDARMWPRNIENAGGHQEILTGEHQHQGCSSICLPRAFDALLDRKPLLVFVNVKSGGQVGAQLMKDFYKILNPIQVVDIQCDGGPQRALQIFKGLADAGRLRVLVCGGDGTAGWVMEEIRKIYGPPTKCRVPVGLLPLVSCRVVMLHTVYLCVCLVCVYLFIHLHFRALATILPVC